MRLTLNLLPPEKKQALRTGVILTFGQSMTLIVCITAIVIAANFVYASMWLKRQSAELINLNGDADGETATLAEQIAGVNAQVSTLRGFHDDVIPWSSVMAAVAGTAAPGIVIDRIAFTKTAIAIEGVAATRDDVLRMKEKLESLPFAEAIDSPLSNILQRTDARFSFTVAVDPSLIR